VNSVTVWQTDSGTELTHIKENAIFPVSRVNHRDPIRDCRDGLESRESRADRGALFDRSINSHYKQMPNHSWIRKRTVGSGPILRADRLRMEDS
jgi:hypothetical protein